MTTDFNSARDATVPHRSHRRGIATALAIAAFLLGPMAAAGAAPVQWSTTDGGTGNWYEYVSTGSIFFTVTFDASRAAAEASSFHGLPGYLVTVTSAAEEAFIEHSFPFLIGFGNATSVWLGAASTPASPTDFRWLGGPEAGHALGYAPWLPGQPVGGPGASDYNDLALSIDYNTPVSSGWQSRQNDGSVFGYIVEYGSGTTPAVPEPGGAALWIAGLGLMGWRAGRQAHR